jgi:hypothetical protein
MREPFSSHCLKLYWGGDVFYANSIKRTASSATEVDVTSMDSTITSDPNNTDRNMIWKEVESCVADPGEVTVDFWAVKEDLYGLPDAIGYKKLLAVKELGTTVDSSGRPQSYETGVTLLSYQCILTKVDIDASVGEYVRGSVTFKLSGYKE